MAKVYKNSYTPVGDKKCEGILWILQTHYPAFNSFGIDSFTTQLGETEGFLER